MEKMADGARLPPISEIIEGIGMGWGQAKVGSLGGGVLLVPGIMMTIITSTTTAYAREWNLDPFLRGGIVSVVFVGMVLGNLLSGPFSDTFGRRYLILLSLFGVTLSALGSSYASHVAQLMLARGIMGMLLGVGLPAFSALAVEITPMRVRSVMTSYTHTLFSIGEIIASLIILWDDPSMQSLHPRSLMRQAAVPSLVVSLTALLLLPESPAFLALSGRFSEAKAVLLSLQRANGADEVAVDFIEPSGDESPSRRSSFSETASRQISVVFGERRLVSTLVVMYSCVVLNVLYYGSMVSFPQILPDLVGGGSAMELLLMSLWEFPGYFLGGLAGVYMLRKTSFRVYLVLEVISHIFFLVGAQHHGSGSWLMEALLRFGFYSIRAFANMGFVVFYQYSVEIYPAEARTTGTAMGLAAGRLGGICVPLVYEILQEATGSYAAFFLLISGMCLLNLLLVGALPFETSNQLLEEYDGQLEERLDAQLSQQLGPGAPDYGSLARAKV